MESSGDFQTMNMIYKMKKIKKNKKAVGVKRNMQNIPPFEVLDNLTGSSQGHSAGANGEQGSPTQEGFGNKRVVIEGVDDTLEGILPGDWDGLDTVISDPTKPAHLAMYDLSGFINEIYKMIITFNCVLALKIANGVDGGKENISQAFMAKNHMIDVNLSHTKFGQSINNAPIVDGTSGISQDIIDDANQLYLYICYLEALIAAYYFAMVWYYVMFYCFIEGSPHKTFFDAISLQKLRANNSAIAMIFLFIFEYSLVIFDHYRWILMDIIPYYGSVAVNKPLCFILLFLFLYYFNTYIVSYLRGFILDLLSSNYNNKLLDLLYVVIIVEYIANNVSKYKNKMSTAATPTAKAEMFMETYANYLTANPAMQILFFLKEVLRIGIILLISVPVGALLCVVHFLWISIGVNYKTLFAGKGTFEAVVRFIYDDVMLEDEQDPCDIPTTFMEKLKRGMKYGLSYFSLGTYNYLIYIILMLYSLHVLLSHLGVINGNGSQMVVQIVNILMLFFTAIVLFINVRTYMKTGMTDIFRLIVKPPVVEFVQSMMGISKVIGGTFLVLILMVFGTVLSMML